MQNEYKHTKEYQSYLDSLPKEFFMEILEKNYNEIIVYDENDNIIYVNPACLRHYGLKPEDMVNQNNSIFSGYWTPEGLKIIHSKKDTIFIKQRFIPSNTEFYTIGIPILDENKDVKMTISTVQEWPVKNWDVNCSEQNNIKSISSKQKHEVATISLNAAYNNMINQIILISKSYVPVLLLGESGSGKDYTAEFIHNNSELKGNFLSINCAAVPETLLESELFGYVPGAFTGASKHGKTGLIEMANNGTLFLNEIGDMPLKLQGKLLDVIENQRYFPVGGTKMKHVNTRIITATNKDLELLVEKGEFREDLYWRICTFKTIIPPLRKRKEDIVLLASRFLQKLNNEYNTTKVFTKEIVHFFINYHWPGNIRQMKNLIEYLFVIATDNEIGINLLPNYLLTEQEDIPEFMNETLPLKKRLDSLKSEIVTKKYKEFHSIRKLAKELEVSQTTAQRLIETYCKNEHNL